MSFREDGYAAVDWAAGYLDRVADLPVLAQVKPGELSERLPEGPPEHGEPFGNVLPDLDDVASLAVVFLDDPPALLNVVTLIGRFVCVHDWPADD